MDNILYVLYQYETCEISVGCIFTTVHNYMWLLTVTNPDYPGIVFLCMHMTHFLLYGDSCYVGLIYINALNIRQTAHLLSIIF